ncbi:methionine adenosyltransferase [Amphibacillus sp. Q70]|uniref:methionine adenosyltransferase n=1 Tax=Amphibacillus sp. Q70 TaxID=3453416 RepID=UPI003F84307B
MRTTYRLTSESVTEGHPDKLCDQISDGILDAYLTKDSEAHVAIECMISNRLLVITGEVWSHAQVNEEKIARAILKQVGYTSQEIGIDADHCWIVKNINQQSDDIYQGIAQTEDKEIGAGDQGMMYGYACRETSELMPLSITLAHHLTRRLSEVRHSGLLPYLLPDGKAQVTVEYDQAHQLIGVTDIVISTQHKEWVSMEQLIADIKRDVIEAVIMPDLINNKTRILINPSGRFVSGGPKADTGLTGRKIIVDTYGGVIPHGGGAFSGKDATKVDRSAAYMARYVAKNLVAADLADRCQIAVSYAIGQVEPISIFIDTFETHKLPLPYLTTIVEEVFDFSPSAMIKQLDLKKPIYLSTSTYGHFKACEPLSWERTDQVDLLRFLAEQIITRIS